MVQKKKIAFFTENLYGGGVERIQQIILRNFNYNKYDITLFSNRKEVLTEDCYPVEHLCYKYIFSSYKENANMISKLICKTKNWIKLFVYNHFSPTIFYKLFIHGNYDIAIAFIEGYATRIVAGGPKDMMKLAWIHTDMENNHWSAIAFHNTEEEKQLYKVFNKLICVSQVVKEKMQSFINVPTRVIYNPIEREKIISLSAEILPEKRQKVGQTIRIMTLGSLEHIKGYGRLLHIAKRLVEDSFDFELLILGKGSKECELKDYAQKEQLNERVKFIGYQDNPYPYLRSCDLYVCSSYAEGYNTSITEALILGKPVVSTDCAGVKEQLGMHNEYGICTPNSESGLYEGIRQMLSLKTLKYYTLQAQKRGKEFTLDNSMKKIYELIEK